MRGLVVSIGGNDVRFADLIVNCLGKEPCFDERAATDPSIPAFTEQYCAPLGVLSFLCEAYLGIAYEQFPGNASEMFFEGTDPNQPDTEHRLGLDDLPATYDALREKLWEHALAGELEGLFEARGDARVYLTAYPSITRREPDTAGGPTQACGFDPAEPVEERLKNPPGLSLTETLWAESVVVPALSSTMQSSAAAHRWRFVDAHVASFDGHGYCAEENWIVRIPQSIRAQIRPSIQPLVDMLTNSANGSVHPNAAGHQAYASAIFGALLCDLYPGCDPAAAPRAPRLATRTIPGSKLALADHATRASKRRITLLAKSALVESPAPGPEDPTRLGGALRVTNANGAGDDALFVLPASGWKGLGKPAGSKGWQYKDPRGAHGPCTSVVVKPGKSVTASCKGAAIPYTLDEPAQDSIAVQLTLGNDATQCMQFGGLVQKDQPAAGKKVGVFQAKNAPAPASCPLP